MAVNAAGTRGRIDSSCRDGPAALLAAAPHRPLFLAGAVAWALPLAHAFLDWCGLAAGLWVCDLPLTAVFAAHWLTWQPWRCLRPGCWACCTITFAWLPVAFALFSVQDLALATGGEQVPGPAPLHAQAIGLFGSMLVAMVTHATQGHSGRPLQMHPPPWLCFVLLQLVAFVRIRAELGGDRYLWRVLAGAVWLIALLPWVPRSAWIYLTPRADGRPG